MRSCYIPGIMLATLWPHIPAIQKLTNKLTNKNKRKANISRLRYAEFLVFSFLEECWQATLLPNHIPAILIMLTRLIRIGEEPQSFFFGALILVCIIPCSIVKH